MKNTFTKLFCVALILIMIICPAFAKGKKPYKNKPLPDNGYGVQYYDKGIKQCEGVMRNGAKYGPWTNYNKSSVEKETGSIQDIITYKNGVAEGEKIMFHANGKKSGEGMMKSGVEDGLWVYYHPNGEKSAEYTFEEGKRVGTATTYYENGNKQYVFTFKDNIREGKGEIYYDSGELQKEGMYKGGKKSGVWKILYKDGSIQAEEFYNENGNLEGAYKLLQKDGSPIILGQCKDGVTNGLWKYYEGVNIKTEVSFGNNLTNGECAFYEGGNLTQKTTYKDNLREGEETKYSTGGTLLVKGFYEDDKMSGKWEYYDENGNLTRFINYAKNRKEGKSEEYYPGTTKIQAKGSYVDGKKGGLWDYLNEDGVITMQIEWAGMAAKKYIAYSNGVKDFEVGLMDVYEPSEISTKKYHNKYIKYFSGTDTISEEGEYKLGSKHGMWKKYDKDGNVTSEERWLLGEKN